MQALAGPSAGPRGREREKGWAGVEGNGPGAGRKKGSWARAGLLGFWAGFLLFLSPF